ncbi:Uma2 family endonuclease [Laspinema olomoucense]|uniref:Uma2 family endonuclease n=1 Tax=Laspinema olomoucense TaxID=3231600 RepID=UPI0021BAB42D|nr:Uma2 family endonuclease [Laspinema sp. D3c]MCT7992742.1 Uma2 family endonuclease [Laspinema sp. D3c]
MIANVKSSGMTVAEYLAWEAEQPIKHEYIDGKVYAMAGATLPHNDIALNLYSLLRSHIRGKGCRVNVSDVKVKVSEQGPYFYPDVVVSCDERDRRAIEAIHYPRLIVEVLSPSTGAFDYGQKFQFYRQIPTFEEYVLIDATQIRIDRYTKNAARKWELTTFPENEEDLAACQLELTSLDFRCALELIYEDVELKGDTNLGIE